MIVLWRAPRAPLLWPPVLVAALLAASAPPAGAEAARPSARAQIEQRIAALGLHWQTADVTADKLATFTSGAIPELPGIGADVAGDLGVFALDADALRAGALPTDLDLSSLLGSARNQGQCGLCTTFAAVAALEAEVNLFSAALFAGSEQAVASCSGIYDSCDVGATVRRVADYLVNYGTVPRSIYPYSANVAACTLDSTTRRAQSVYANSWQRLRIGSADELKTALFRLQRPLVANFRVPTDFYSYGSGTYSPTTTEVGAYHAVLVVGYSDSLQAFKVRNSWGTGWGEAGYFHLAYSEVQPDSITQFGRDGASAFQGVRGQVVPSAMACHEANASSAFCDIAAGTDTYVDFVISGEALAYSDGSNSGSMQLDMSIDGINCNPSAGVAVGVDNETLLSGAGYTCHQRLTDGQQLRVSLVAPNNRATALYTRATVSAEEHAISELQTAGACVSDTPISAWCELSTAFSVQYADFVVQGEADAVSDGTGSGSMQLNMSVDGIPCNSAHGVTVGVDNETVLSGDGYSCSLRVPGGHSVRIALLAPNDRADAVYTRAEATLETGPSAQPPHISALPRVFFDGFDTRLAR